MKFNMIRSFKGIYWITSFEVAYSFSIGCKYFVCALDQPVQAGKSVVLVCINKWGQLGVKSEDDLSIIEKVKIFINKKIWEWNLFKFTKYMARQGIVEAGNSAPNSRKPKLAKSAMESEL